MIDLDLPADLRFRLTLTQPLLLTDRIPAAFSTNIEFPCSPKNLSIFGFTDKLFIKPRNPKVPVVISYNGLSFLSGILDFDIYEDQTIKASFVGTIIEDSLKEDINKITLPEWIFESDSEEDLQPYWDLLKSAVNNSEPFVVGPIKRSNGLDPLDEEEESANLSYYNSIYLNYYDVIQKFNHTTSRPGRRSYLGYQCPAVKLSVLLQGLFSGKLDASNFDMSVFDDIVLITTSKPKGNPYDPYLGGLEPDENNPPRYHFSLASALPAINANELIKEVLKLNCATIFPSGSGYSIRQNKDILTDPSFIDWSNKISDNYSIQIEEGKTYKYGYSQTSTDETAGDTPIEVPDIVSMVRYEHQEDHTYFLIQNTGDIYRRVYIGDLLNYPYYDFDIVRQGYTEPINTSSENYYDMTSKITPPKMCVRKIPLTTYPSVHRYWEVPFMEIPGSGGERPADVFFGLFHGLVSVANAKTGFAEFQYPLITSNNYDVNGAILGNKSLSWYGDEGLYIKHHKEFAEWIGKNKARMKSLLNLSIHDLRSIQLHVKRLIKGRLFFIDTIDVDITNEGIELAEGTFLEA